MSTQETPEREIILADPRGFCAGVDRAIQTVETILRTSRKPRVDGLPPVYVRRQIVHNTHVVEALAAQGAVFVEELSEVPDAAAQAQIPIVFSAHGVSPAVQDEAVRRHLAVIDATCPLVSKVHREVVRYVHEGYHIIYIGHQGHDEAIGVIGEAPDDVTLIQHVHDVDQLEFADTTKLVYLTQTTLSLDETREVIEALEKKFPHIVGPAKSDICYATHNRQHAVMAVARESDCVIVVGSANSSNSVRLVEVAQQALGERGYAYRVDDATELDPQWVSNAHSVGITSGASVPDRLVEDVIAQLKAWGFGGVRTAEGVKETMHFALPNQIRKMTQA